MIVMKFGGSSLESAKAIQRAAFIVASHRDRNPVVVVSAMGKTTDQLLALAQFCVAGKQDEARRELTRLRDFYVRETGTLLRPNHKPFVDEIIFPHFQELEELLAKVTSGGALTPRLSDAILSFGERLSSLVVRAAFQFAGVDAIHLDSRTVVITDDRHTCARLLRIETNALLRRRVSRQHVTVMGGFIAATEEGVGTTLGRGGSDYTAAIVGAAIGADEIQIWTDVDGMLTCDPRMVPEAHCLRSISYSQAEEMAKSGAKVLRPATVLPAAQQRIPVVIRNSRNPEAAGTRIISENAQCDRGVLSIACRTDITVLHVRPRNTPVTSEFGREIWDALEKLGVSFELISPAVKEFSLALNTASVTTALENNLSTLADLTAENGRALITLVGHNTPQRANSIARAAERLGKVAGGRLLTHCTDLRFGFVVALDSLRIAACELHREFFSNPDPALFVPYRNSGASTAQSTRKLCERPALTNRTSALA
jgi:aspartate kinase